MELIILALPFVTTAIMFGVKKLAGFAMFQNGAEAHPFLRFLLFVVSLIGILAWSLVTGNEVDPNQVSELAGTALLTLINAVASHLLYRGVRAVREEGGDRMLD